MFRVFNDQFVIAEGVGSLEAAVAIAKPFSVGKPVAIVDCGAVAEGATVVWDVTDGELRACSKIERLD